MLQWDDVRKALRRKNHETRVKQCSLRGQSLVRYPSVCKILLRISEYEQKEDMIYLT